MGVAMVADYSCGGSSYKQGARRFDFPLTRCISAVNYLLSTLTVPLDWAGRPKRWACAVCPEFERKLARCEIGGLWLRPEAEGTFGESVRARVSGICHKCTESPRQGMKWAG